MSAPVQVVAVTRLPQVNLLPPEIRSKRGLVRVKRWLAAVLVLAAVISAGVVALAWTAQRAAHEELRLAEDETARLLAEQVQYAEVPEVLNKLETIKAARQVGTSTEVMWAEYLSAIGATAPAGVSIETLSVSGATPMLLPVPTVDPLQAASVATVTFTARSATLPDTGAWLDGLATVPGFADAWFTSATVSEEDGTTYYTVAATVQITEDAYVGRFATEAGES